MSREFHITMQGKGGVGKSTAARLLIEFLTEKGRSVDAYDLDPTNPTLSHCKPIKATVADITDGDEIDPRKFDDLVEKVVRGKKDIVVDCGASTFSPMMRYASDLDLFAMLKDEGKLDCYIHTVVSGGGDLVDTLQGYDALAKRFGDTARLVLWLNPHNGPLEMNGSEFTEWPVITKHLDVTAGHIVMPVLDARTAGKDLTDMFTKHMTFGEALDASSPFGMVMKQRLKRVKEQYWTAIEQGLNPVAEAAE